MKSGDVLFFSCVVSFLLFCFLRQELGVGTPIWGI